MIIFDLDTLADDTHRRHFIDPLHPKNIDDAEMLSYNANGELIKAIGWQPDYEAYNAACGDDDLIYSTRKVLYDLECVEGRYKINILTARCESIKEQTKDWLFKHDIYYGCLKMRPIGNTEPAHVLKERWLEDTLIETKWGNKYGVDFVFDADPDSIAMFRRYGVYVFDCRQE